jgi:pyruvate kinase
VFRLNFSDGTQAESQRRLQWVREAERIVGRPLGVLLELQGPDLRIGRLVEPIMLQVGSVLDLVLSAEQQRAGDPVPLPHREVFQALDVGQQLLVGDGQLRFTVLSAQGETARVRSEVAGLLQECKGLTLPDSVLPLPALTPDDLRDLAFGLALGVDWIVMGCVQTEADLRQLRELVNRRAGLIAKIETSSAVERLQGLLEASDAVMITCGHRGVDLSAEVVTGVQRRIARMARELGKPVIVATQMPEPTIESPLPTRTEAADVATAVYDGVDAVLLSAESASGRKPVDTARMMASIVERVESDPRQQRLMAAVTARMHGDAADAIGVAVRVVAQTVPLSVTVTYTLSGASALRVAHERPRTPLIGLTPNADTARKLALVWGVRPVVAPDPVDIDDMVALATAVVRKLCPNAEQRVIAIVAGMPFGTAGATNMLRLVMPKSAGVAGAAESSGAQSSAAGSSAVGI